MHARWFAVVSGTLYKMRYLSVFSGIEACTEAWEPLGWQAVAYCEYDKFPSTLLDYRRPETINLGDITKVTDDQIRQLGHIDIVVGGSPCQDLSVAGKRAGLDGERSGLFYEQLRIFHAARHFCGATKLLWENVPGAFSSNSGADFAQVVGEMAGCAVNVPRDGWENTGVALGENGLVEWCVLDAQWFGVPQRRRRVFTLLDTGDWSSRPPILFEPESLRGDSPPSREAGQDIAPTISARTKGGGGLGTDFDLDGGVIQEPANIQDIASTLDASFGRLQGCSHNDMNHGHSHLITAYGQNNTSGPNDTSHGLSANRGTHNPGDFEAGTLLVEPVPTVVRRLTPLECERLQGFPDNYTRIPYRGRGANVCPDGPRYKALGNSMAVPCMSWIGKRIQEATI